MSEDRNHFVLECGNFQELLDALVKRGYRVGASVRDGAIVYDTLSSTADLPSGWTDEQNSGTIDCEDAMIQRCLATPLDRSPGGNFYTRHSCEFGKPAVKGIALKFEKNRERT